MTEPLWSGWYGRAGGARPDFVLVGRPAPGGVELWASTELSYAELEAETRYRAGEFEDLIGQVAGSSPAPVSHTVTLRAGLRKFVVVRAATYPEALAVLLQRPDWVASGPAAIAP